MSSYFSIKNKPNLYFKTCPKCSTGTIALVPLADVIEAKCLNCGFTKEFFYKRKIDRLKPLDLTLCEGSNQYALHGSTAVSYYKSRNGTEPSYSGRCGVCMRIKQTDKNRIVVEHAFVPLKHPVRPNNVELGLENAY